MHPYVFIVLFDPVVKQIGPFSNWHIFILQVATSMLARLNAKYKENGPEPNGCILCFIWRKTKVCYNQYNKFLCEYYARMRPNIPISAIQKCKLNNTLSITTLKVSHNT